MTNTLTAGFRPSTTVQRAAAPYSASTSSYGVSEQSGASKRNRSNSSIGFHPSATADLRDTLYADFAPLVARLIHQYGVTPELRNDLRGEIYYRFSTILSDYDPERGVPLKPYLVRQLTASIYTYARKQWSIKRRETALEAEECMSGQAMPAVDPTPTWDADLARKQVASSLPAAITKLPDRQRKVVVWRYYEDRSFEEIASRLNVETSTARSLLRHGLTNLRKQMHAGGGMEV